MRTRVLITVMFLAVPLLAIACGGDDDDNGDDAGPTASPASLNTSIASGSDPVGLGTLEVDGETYELQVESCQLPVTQNGPFGFNAITEGEGVFGFAGVAGAASIGFTIGDDQYTAVAAQVTIDGVNMSYDGEALKTGTPSEAVPMAFEVEC